MKKSEALSFAEVLASAVLAEIKNFLDHKSSASCCGQASTGARASLACAMQQLNF